MNIGTTWLAGVVTALALGANASAADPASYAVIALIGDQLTVVTYQPEVGSRIDVNSRQVVRTAGGDFDRTATDAAVAALRRAAPGATTLTLAIDDPAAYAHSSELASSAAQMKTFVDPVAKELAADGTQWLVLISKHRGAARLQTTTGPIGSGNLDGLGFYIDRYKRMVQVDTGESGAGFLAPFVYLNVSLVDLRTGQVVRTTSVEDSTTVATPRSGNAMHPWDTMTGSEKARRLSAMIRHAVEDAVPQLLPPA